MLIAAVCLFAYENKKRAYQALKKCICCTAGRKWVWLPVKILAL